MHTVDTITADKLEGWFEHDDSVHFRGSFVLHGGNGAENSAAVVIELEPGKALGEHTDSPEEILIVMAGDVEFQIGDERQRATPGTVAVVPPLKPHNMRNVGTTPARIVGFFPSPHVVSTFAEPIKPLDIQVLVHGDPNKASAGDERERNDAGNRRGDTTDAAARHAQGGHDTSQDGLALPRSTRRFQLR